MYLFYSILFIFILISDTLSFIPGIGYWDEAALFVSVFILIIRNRYRIKIKKEKIVDWSIIVVMIILGLIGNLVNSGYQGSYVAIFKDILAFLKFPVVMLALRDVSNTYEDDHNKYYRIIKNAAIISKLFVVSSICGIVLGKIVNLGFYVDEIRIVQTYKFCFSHPTFFVSALVIVMAILFAEGSKKNKYYILLSCVPLFMAQRFKGYAVLALVLFLIFVGKDRCMKMFSLRNNIRHIKKRYIIPVIIMFSFILYYIFKDRMGTYLSWGMTSARIALYVIGFRILIDAFPFGSGFGTFGSFISGEYYSNVYHKYGIDIVDGLRPDKYNYISDTYWPWIYGQFGFIGLLGYIILIKRLITYQFKRITQDDSLLAFIIVWFYIILACFMEAYLTNASSVAMAILLNVFIGVDKKK